MRRLTLFVICFLLAVSGNVAAQNPDVIIKLDATFQGLKSDGKDWDFRLYDVMGRMSTLSLDFSIEPGFNFIISERLQRPKGEPDREQLDEYYIEDRGYWRAGKQYLPFGRNVVLRESVYAGTVNSTVGERAVPLRIGYANGGTGRQSGLIGRIGGKVGASFALGEHWSISSTSLNPVRLPTQSPGRERGYRQVIGVDGQARLSHTMTVGLDHASFRRGMTSLDDELDVTDVTFTYAPRQDRNLTAGFSQEWKSGDTFIRLSGAYPVIDNVWFESFLRYRNGEFSDFAFGFRLKP